ncbi:MAG: hypothetical protein NW223_05195 [Hyphomicrobiaceae bacterium]|nr:hypothetical protein [Hyphomicrobiaceae bacterium]
MMDARPQLSPAQVAELHAWEGFLGRFYVGGILAILAAMAVLLLAGDNVLLRRTALVGVVGLIVAATVIQRRVRCPNCKARLGFPSKMRFPDFCPSCRAHFPRPEGG